MKTPLEVPSPEGAFVDPVLLRGADFITITRWESVERAGEPIRRSDRSPPARLVAVSKLDHLLARAI